MKPKPISNLENDIYLLMRERVSKSVIDTMDTGIRGGMTRPQAMTICIICLMDMMIVAMTTAARAPAEEIANTVYQRALFLAENDDEQTTAQ